MANFRYSHLYTTKTGSSAITAAESALKQAEIALAIAEGEEKILFKNENDDVVSVATEAQINSLIETVQTSITNEVERATEAESALSDSIADEETRAKGVEDSLSDRISAIESGSTQALEDEIERATAAEGELAEAISGETDARTAADEELSDEIEAEHQRAVSAETELLDIIEEEVRERKASAFSNVKYDESGKTIDFYNANNVKIASIDATDFIKDGMIDSVELVVLSGDTYLRITWNTDAGKEVTDLNIGDIFNADNYYTKAEVDDIVSGLTEVMDENERVTSEALNDLNSRISGAGDAISAETEARISADTAEATARDNADVKSVAVDANGGITLTLGNGSTIVATEAEEITLSAGEF